MPGKYINKIANIFGVHIVKDRYWKQMIGTKNEKSNSCPSTEDRLRHAATIGFQPQTILDGGAFIGRWAREVHEIFPQARILMIEPNHKMNERMNEYISDFSDQVQVLNVALSDVEGTASLNVWANSKHNDETTRYAASSLLGHVQGPASERIEVRTATIDQIIQETGDSIDLMKLDLQGWEKAALEGAANTLESTEMVVVEFGLLDAYQGRTTPGDLIKIMDQHKFVLYDVAGLRYRPYDGAMVGGDFIFVKNTSRLKEHKDYF